MLVLLLRFVADGGRNYGRVLIMTDPRTDPVHAEVHSI
jgi:hypothetical protein